MPVGVVGLARIARMLVTGGKFDDRGAPRVEPQPERAAPRRGAQVRGDLGGRREPLRVAGLVGGDVLVGDVDRRR